MNEARDLLLLTQDSAVESAVKEALRAQGSALTRPPIRDLRELQLHTARNTSASGVVLVDLDADWKRGIGELERFSFRWPNWRIAALVNSLDSEMLLAVMQAGVRHVVPKQSIRSELRQALARLTSEGAAAGPAGEMITILSASGGCGATTLAVNLGQELAARKNQPALLIDLDTAYGAVATYLGVEPQHSIHHVLSHAGTIDAELIRSTATAHSSHLHVLASPASTAFSHPPALSFDRIDSVLEAARRAYSHVIVDAPRVSMDTAAALVSGGTRALLVFQLTVKDVRIARAMLGALAERGIAADSVMPLAMRYAKRIHMVSLEDAAKALDVATPIGFVHNDYQSAVRGMNYGQTLSDAAPRSALRRDLQDLLGRLVPTNGHSPL